MRSLGPQPRPSRIHHVSDFNQLVLVGGLPGPRPSSFILKANCEEGGHPGLCLSLPTASLTEPERRRQLFSYLTSNPQVWSQNSGANVGW